MYIHSHRRFHHIIHPNFIIEKPALYQFEKIYKYAGKI